MGLMSGSFRRFFRGEPWNENLMCPMCKRSDDFGPDSSWGEEGPNICPVCGTITTPFWSDERVREYLSREPGIIGLVTRDGDVVTGWAWGYPKGADEFYVDTVGILEEWRRTLAEHLRAFRWFLEELKGMGYQIVTTRTHNKARNVHLLLRHFGFVQAGESTEDPSRSFWELRLLEPLA